MAISSEEVRKIAWLARLRFEPDEIEKYKEDLSKILDYFKILDDIDSSGIEFTKSANSAPLRDDIPYQSLPKVEALKNAPAVKDGMFNVPKVI
ncbi:MAG: Asp-tRNA(Asn)/Glu-tRNA(Gln) amidotransferase subunit GatC [candidate division Zixibacteria bacterium]|nr:Asp-tRNA(Asn)/Glu-tRNA(Gln) amidotransferase subunit GatC [candidate division Zixibacteria bacterium]